MSDATMQLEVVAADRLVWSGEAKMIIARTTEGEIGILPHHQPTLSIMVDGVVEVTSGDGDRWVAAVDAGFLSVAGNRVSVLSEHAELAEDIDVDKARSELEEAESSEEDDEAAKHTRLWAEARIKAAEQKS